MGGTAAHLEPHESVAALLKFYKAATHAHSGGFWNHLGEAVLR
jgi:hypothetical protein